MTTDAKNLLIMLIEDHDNLRQATTAQLEKHGHTVIALGSAEDVDCARTKSTPELYIIDLNLPGEDGLSLARRIRQSQPQVGIIITTARTGLHDKVEGYESGADIYLSKPIDPIELIATINALSRRLQDKQTDQGCTIDTHKMQVSGPLGTQTLLVVELKLLLALARAAGHTLEHWQLIEVMHANENLISKPNLEVRIARLRKKLLAVGFPNPAIKAVQRVGYRLVGQLQIV